MNIRKSNDNDKNISRRKFLKGGAILGTAVGLSSLPRGKVTEEVTKAIGKKELDSFPHEISPDFKRYDSRRLIANSIPMEKLEGLPGLMGVIDDYKPGYTTLDFALAMGAGAVQADLGGLNGFDVNSPLYPWDKKPSEYKYEFASKEDATKAIKRAAKFYGADLVGITAYDEKWTYDTILSVSTGELFYETDFPFKPKSVIVMAFEMDYEVMSTAPTTLADATTELGYSTMAEVNYKLSTFIRTLGHNAFGVGNEVTLTVPYAIAAGLGEQGRQGLLITYEYGPRVRLCKIFTDLDLVYDKPIEFGANKFCQVCKKCAQNCPSQSIPFEDEMTWKGDPYIESNMEGVKKYYVNVESCFVYWNTIGNSCSVCISSCPFNKPDFWHHRISTALTATPLKPFLNEMDDLFGYGNIYDDQVCIDFWDLETYAGQKY